MKDNRFVFIFSLHRSGTSLPNETIRSHPEVSGLSRTATLLNAGQHLQGLFPAACVYGGPGMFVVILRPQIIGELQSRAQTCAYKLRSKWNPAKPDWIAWQDETNPAEHAK